MDLSGVDMRDMRAGNARPYVRRFSAVVGVAGGVGVYVCATVKVCQPATQAVQTPLSRLRPYKFTT
ncbi:MAG: hypothetical protein FWH20_03590 [Oscillospiraceae bacterium]|nr:hypothetical protein [Oscillospiraceae bacterium]